MTERKGITRKERRQILEFLDYISGILITDQRKSDLKNIVNIISALPLHDKEIKMSVVEKALEDAGWIRCSHRIPNTTIVYFNTYRALQLIFDSNENLVRTWYCPHDLLGGDLIDFDCGGD